MATIGEVLGAAAKCYQTGDLAGAERLYRDVLEADANNAEAWFRLGLLARARGDLTALDHLQRAIQLDARQPAFHLQLADAYYALGKLPEAEASCREALRRKADFAAALSLLGAVLNDQGRYTEAASSCRLAIACDPKLSQAHCNLGVVLHSLGQVDEAIAAYRRALECNPDQAAAAFNLGVIMQERGATAEAKEYYRRAILSRPDLADAHNNLGTLYNVEHKLAEAIACYERALELRPNFAAVLNNLGNVLKTQGRFAEAAVCHEQALRITPDHAQARANWALARLAAGDLAGGWPDYEYRWACPGFARRTFSQPRWQGEPLAGRVLLVHAEQGLGDAMQFVRYLPLVAERGGKLILEVPRALVPLFEQSGIGRLAALVSAGSPLPDFAVQVPLLSLPGLFGTTLDTIPAQTPYLAADPRLVERWRKALAGPGFKVGIGWQGTKTYPGDRFRSIPLAQFAPLAQTGAELISLQRGAGTEQLADVGGSFAVRDLGNNVDQEHGPFMDTAAIMQCLDLVITSDTAIAHLAGALGVDVWVALGLGPDWRWMYERADSPWYPTMRLFRQRRLDDWPEVFESIAAALRVEIAGRRRVED